MNRLREFYDFTGTPLRIQLAEGSLDATVD